MSSIDGSIGGFEENIESSWEELPRIEVTTEQLTARLSEWVELAKQYPGEAVVFFDKNESILPLSMGRIRNDWDQDETVSLDEPMAITDGQYVRSDGNNLQIIDYIKRLSPINIEESFQLFTPKVNADGVPRFQVAFGNEAVATWFAENTQMWPVQPHLYILMSKKLGIEPVINPDVLDETAEYRLDITRRLIATAIKNTILTRNIVSVYDNIGRGIVDDASAGRITHLQRRERDSNYQLMARWKTELVSLGVDPDAYYMSIALEMGLDLPSRGIGEDLPD